MATVTTTTSATSSSPPVSNNTQPVPPTILFEDVSYRFPDQRTLYEAFKLSIIEDKPILGDYWIDSIQKKVVIGVKEISDEPLLANGKKPTEKYLIKTEYDNVYTSPIGRLAKCGNDYIVVTENTIYLVDNGISNIRVKSLGTDE